MSWGSSEALTNLIAVHRSTPASNSSEEKQVLDPDF
jgi:hypothetical protein